MLQKTLMASRLQPWLGSIQYSPAVGQSAMVSGEVRDVGASGLSPAAAGGGTAGPALTALPVGVAHLEVTAGAGRVLAAAFRAPDVLDLLAQALESGVHLEVTVTDHVGIIGPVVAATILSLLLRWLGQEAEVVTTAGRTRGTRGSGRAGGTLRREGGEGGLPGFSAFGAGGPGADKVGDHIQQDQHHQCDHEDQGDRWGLGDR